MCRAWARRVVLPMNNRTPAMGPREWVLLLILATIWGGSFFFTGIAVRELPAVTLVWFRLALGALALLAIVRALGQRMPSEPRVWGAFLGMGLLNNAAPFVLIAWGQHHIASGLASILNATTPLFTVLAAHALTQDERLTRLKLAGVVAGLGGAVVMVGPSALAGLGDDLLAQAACLAAAISYALANIWGRRFRAMGVAPVTTAAGQVCASALLLFVPMLIVDQPWTVPVPHAATIGAVLGLALLCTAMAYVLFFRILAAAGATSMALVTFLVPVSAILLGTVFLHEALLPRHLGGMALIAVGLVLIDGRVVRRILGLAIAAQSNSPLFNSMRHKQRQKRSQRE